jgi:hypothetical protein
MDRGTARSDLRTDGHAVDRVVVWLRQRRRSTDTHVKAVEFEQDDGAPHAVLQQSFGQQAGLAQYIIQRPADSDHFENGFLVMHKGARAIGFFGCHAVAIFADAQGGFSRFALRDVAGDRLDRKFSLVQERRGTRFDFNCAAVAAQVFLLHRRHDLACCKHMRDARLHGGNEIGMNQFGNGQSEQVVDGGSAQQGNGRLVAVDKTAVLQHQHGVRRQLDERFEAVVEYRLVRLCRFGSVLGVLGYHARNCIPGMAAKT